MSGRILHQERCHRKPKTKPKSGRKDALNALRDRIRGVNGSLEIELPSIYKDYRDSGGKIRWKRFGFVAKSLAEEAKETGGNEPQVQLAG